MTNARDVDFAQPVGHRRWSHGTSTGVRGADYFIEEVAWRIHSTAKRELAVGHAERRPAASVLYLVLRGTLDIVEGAHHDRVAAGDAVLSRIATDHVVRTDDGAEFVTGVLEVDPATRVDVPERMVVGGFTGRHPGVAAMLTSCLLTQCDPSPGARSVAGGFAQIVGSAVLQSWIEADPVRASPLVATARGSAIAPAIASVLASPSEPWGLRQLASIAHLAPSTLVEHFRTELGMAPGQFIRESRMARARTLLRETEATIATVAAETGFGSTAAFTRAFARAHGAPPKSWRRSARGGESNERKGQASEHRDRAA